MKLPRAILAIASAAAIAAPVAAAAPPAASDPPSASGAASRLDDNLLKAFWDICLDRRGSWDGMKQAVESSELGFKRERGGSRREANYVAFPLQVSIKRWGQVGFLCLVQSLVEDDLSASDIAARLQATSVGLRDVTFTPTDEGLSGTLPGTGRSTSVGMMSTKVEVRLSPTTLAGAQIAQLVVYQN